MSNTTHASDAGYCSHVLNRSVGKMPQFAEDPDFEAFRHVMIETHRSYPNRILAYCVPGPVASAGVMALIQPGGSKRDNETLAACDEHGMAMILTGRRHFRH